MTVANALNIHFLANQLIYADTATDLTGLATIPNGILITSALGVPSISTSIPSFTIGGLTFSGNSIYSTIGIQLVPAPGQVVGSTGNFQITNGSALVLYNAATTFGIYIQAPPLLAQTGSYYLPSLMPTSGAVLTAQPNGNMTWANLLDGQVVIGSTAGAPIGANITPGPGINIVNGANSITISAAGAGFAWQQILTPTQQLAVENGYINARAGGITYTLPATAALGDTIIILGFNGATTVAQNANQQIFILNASTTVGVGGSIVSNNLGQSITLVCVVAGPNTIWDAHPVTGNWAIN
jgi:hypothetical protein